MFLARVLVVLLSTGMGCRYKVTAFRSSLPICSRSSSKMSPISLDGANSKDDNGSVTPEHHVQLLDESMMLYYQVSQGISNIEDDNDDAIAQRKDELTRLIEDLVFEENGIVRESAEDTTATTAAADNSSQEVTTTNMDSSTTTTSSNNTSLEELSLALDEQILLGSQSVFTEDELKEWVAKIDELRDKILEAQLIALPASTSSTNNTTTNTTATTTATTTPSNDAGPEASAESETETTTTGTTSVEELQQRLESVRTSIEHVGNAQ